MAQSRRTPRHRKHWTEEEKQSLIRKVAAVPPGGVNAFLETQGIGARSSWFYRMRRDYLAAHPKFDPHAPASDVPTVALQSPAKKSSKSTGIVSYWYGMTPEQRSAEMSRRMKVRLQKNQPTGAFPNLPQAEKIRLIEEYSAIPSTKQFYAAKEAWRKEHGVTPPMLNYYRGAFGMKAKDPAHKPGPKPAQDPAVASAIAAYKNLPKHEKPSWREAHHLSPSQMSAIMCGKATSGILARVLELNGHGPTIRDQRLSRLLEPIPVQNMIPNSAPPLISVPVTLDDAILAFQVKMDHMNEFIDQLKRMQRGSR